MISVTLKSLFIAVMFLSNQVYMQQSIYENIPINSIVIRPGQEYKPQNYYSTTPQNYNSYSCYQFGSYGQPASLGEIVYYPHLVPENLRSEEEYATLYNSPGDSCSSTVCASVYYNFEGINKPKCDCRKSECDCSTKREKPDFENNSGCICNKSGNKLKSSNCSCNKSTCGCNSEYTCNKQKYDCESCTDFCLSSCELDDECSRYSCFEKPTCAKCEPKKCKCSSKCGCGEPKCCENSDVILDSLRVVDELLKRLLNDACDYV